MSSSWGEDEGTTSLVALSLANVQSWAPSLYGRDRLDMSVMFVCDGCGLVEDGTWHYGHEEVWDDQRGLASKSEGGCGNKFKRIRFTESEWRRPVVPVGQSGGGNYWWSREDRDGQQHACSRGCIEKVATNTGKLAMVLPW